jgi:diadenosine tetraphosphate (Ap4A) HIT family hydrolase
MHANHLAVVIRNAFPVSSGHTLVLPRRHVGSFFELASPERDAVFELLDVARRDLNQTLPPDGYNIGINDGSAAGHRATPACAPDPALQRRPGRSTWWCAVDLSGAC